MGYTASITAEGDAKLIRKVFAAEDRLIGGKASYSTRKTQAGLVFEVKAEDSTALRAALNSITKALTVIEKTKKI